MTSDAKVGLLLGLVFIFIIAFVINGLPNFYKDKNNNELTTNMVIPQNKNLGLAAKERKINYEIIRKTQPAKNRPLNNYSSLKYDQDVRFVTSLPKSFPTRKETIKAKVVSAIQSLAIAKSESKVSLRAYKKDLPKIYTVQSGDNLAVIAKKVYGHKRGNQHKSIAAIFKANHKKLKSPDQLYVGQKIIVPMLSNSAQGKKNRTVKKVVLKNTKRYIVQDGDSLWQIAAKQLGNGSRYQEIVKINSRILGNEDSLTLGMRLTLPVR